MTKIKSYFKCLLPLFTVLIFSQCKPINLNSRLIDGYPEAFNWIINHTNDSLVTSSKLKTGIDSLNIYFGEGVSTCNNKKNKSYWIGALLNDTVFLAYKGFSVTNSDSNSILSKDLNLVVRKFSMSFDIRLSFNPLTKRVNYVWLNKGMPSKVLKPGKLNDEKSKWIGKQFPPINYLTLNHSHPKV